MAEEWIIKNADAIPWPERVGNQKNAVAPSCPPCTGNCSQVRDCPWNAPRKIVVVPAGNLTIDEIRQAPMRWSGLTLAAAIVLSIAVGVLVAHAIARQGWLS